MVLEMIRQGMLVQQSRSSAEAKSLNTKVKGTIWLPLQWGSSQGSQTGGQRAELKGYSHRESIQGESWTKALDLIKLGQKAARQENASPLLRKSYSLFIRVTAKKGIADDDDDDDE
jgi:hypothetical protein